MRSALDPETMGFYKKEVIEESKGVNGEKEEKVLEELVRS